MSKLTDVLIGMSDTVSKYYIAGNGAGKYEVNPHKGNVMCRQAWSAGHFDTWGRVANLALTHL